MPTHTGAAQILEQKLAAGADFDSTKTISSTLCNHYYCIGEREKLTNLAANPNADAKSIVMELLHLTKHMPKNAACAFEPALLALKSKDADARLLALMLLSGIEPQVDRNACQKLVFSLKKLSDGDKDKTVQKTAADMLGRLELFKKRFPFPAAATFKTESFPAPGKPKFDTTPRQQVLRH